MTTTNGTRAFHNRTTGEVWLSYPDGRNDRLGNTAASDTPAYAILAVAGMIRTGDWLIEYGQVRSAAVRAA